MRGYNVLADAKFNDCDARLLIKKLRKIQGVSLIEVMEGTWGGFSSFPIGLGVYGHFDASRVSNIITSLGYSIVESKIENDKWK